MRKIKRPSPLRKKARRGFRGYPVATVAFYGPTDQRASKVAVGIITREGAEPDKLQRWFSVDGDVRTDPEVGANIPRFIEAHKVKSVALADRIMGCPHEEGIDYPDGGTCPACPFWAHRNRFSGETSH